MFTFGIIFGHQKYQGKLRNGSKSSWLPGRCIRLELAKRCGLCGICKICAYSLIVSKSEYDIHNSDNIEWRLCMTRFQLILPVQSQNVTKNRTDNRMHIEGIQFWILPFYRKCVQHATVIRTVCLILCCLQLY